MKYKKEMSFGRQGDHRKWTLRTWIKHEQPGKMDGSSEIIKKCWKFKSQFLWKKKDGLYRHKRRNYIRGRKIQILKYEREWLEDTAEMSSLKKFLDEPETSELCASEQESRRGRLKKGGMKRIIRESWNMFLRWLPCKWDGGRGRDVFENATGGKWGRSVTEVNIFFFEPRKANWGSLCRSGGYFCIPKWLTGNKHWLHVIQVKQIELFPSDTFDEAVVNQSCLSPRPWLYYTEFNCMACVILFHQSLK